MTEMNEEALVDALQKGDEAAFRQLILKFGDMVQLVIQRMVANEEDAKDLSQEVFVKVWESIGSFKKQSTLKTWIYRISIHHTLNYLRAQKLRNLFRPADGLESLKEIASDDKSGFDVLQQKEQHNLIRLALDKLPARQKAVFVLSKAEGFSNAETAEIMGTTVKAVESLLVRAKKSLQDDLKNQFMKDDKN